MPPQNKPQPRDWKYFFERRKIAAVEGRHLPSTKDLMIGQSFFYDDLRRDAQTWAERLLMRLDALNAAPLYAPVSDALKRLTVIPDVNDFAHAGMILYERVAPDERWLPRSEARRRCIVYGAALGDSVAISALCAELAKELKQWRGHFDEASYGLYTLVGAAAHLDAPLEGAFRRADIGDFRMNGERVARRLDFLELQSKPPTAAVKLGTDGAEKPEVRAGQQAGPMDKAALKSEDGDKGKIVFRAIGNEKLLEKGAVKELIMPLLGKQLPLRPVPALAAMASTLRNEFPHALNVIDVILGDLAGRDDFAMRPTLLAGPPGCGKTTFAIRLAELSGLPWQLFPCAGVSDARFTGTARGWSSGEPAMPTSLVMSTAVANPLIILDELEKAGGSISNGNFLEGLLPLLEPRSASVYFDVFIEANVDLSSLVFIATANDPARIPTPLRDRCRILVFPSPEPVHLQAAVPGLLKGIITARGLDPRWVPPLTTTEIDALAASWRGGSLRALQRMIEAVLRARDHEVEFH